MCGTTDSLTDVWHDVSRPFVDSTLGRAALNVGTGGMAAPALAAYDISRGADPLKAAAGGALGYFGGQAGSDALGSMFGSSQPLASGMGEMMGDWTPEAGNGLGGLSQASSSAGTSAPTWGNISPLEDTAGASMDTAGLNTNPGWLSRMGGSAAKTMGDAWSAEGIGKSLGNMGPVGVAAGLMDMFSKKKQASDQMDRFNQTQNQITGLYAPGSPEYNALWDQMSRTDAAAGRNSQVGPRSVDLAAKIAQIKANMLGQTLGNQNAMFNTATDTSNTGLGSLFAQWQKANTPRMPTYNIYTGGR